MNYVPAEQPIPGLQFWPTTEGLEIITITGGAVKQCGILWL